MTNPTYQQKFRHSSFPQQEPPARRPRRKRFSLLKTALMLIGAATVLVLLMRYAIVPLLVLLPQWQGGTP